jgi:hypothetical protein
MKQSLKLSASLLVGATSLMAVTPAFAQTYDYSSGGDAAAGGIVCGVYACMGIPALLLTVLWVWMLIDAVSRQEYEYPNSSGNSKLIWILLLVFLNGIAPIFYFFMVYKKIKRGSMAPPAGGGYVPPAGGYQPPPGNYPPPPGAGSPPPPPPAPPAPPAQ